MKKEKGFALLLTFFVLIALSTMSIAMLGIIQTSSVNVARSHQVNSVIQAAEYGIDTGRLWLVDQLTKTGLNPIVITNSRNGEVLGDCLALHGYTDIAQFVYYAHQQDKIVLVNPGSDSNFGRYKVNMANKIPHFYLGGPNKGIAKKVKLTDVADPSTKIAVYYKKL